MKSYTLNYANGGKCTEFFAENDEEAVELALCQIVAGGSSYCAEPVAADQWDQAGMNNDDGPCKRLLIWSDEASAENDSGANAIAQIETIGQA